jgi:MFS family permease
VSEEGADLVAQRTAAAEAEAGRLRVGSPRAWARALGALAVLSFAAAIPLSLLSHQLVSGVIAAVIGVPCAAVGMVVIRRQRENPLGWLFLVIGVCLFLSTVGADYAVLVYRLGRRLPFGPVGLVLDEIWGPSLVLFAVVILLFPDGRLPSRFWRGALRVYGVWFAALLAATGAAMGGALAAHPVRVDSNGGLAAVDHPAGWFNAAQGLLIFVLLGLSLAFIARQALSWRRATGERRQQLKWLASGATVSIICLFVAASSSSSGNGPTLWGVLSSLAWMGVAALPVSIGVAILKYRLYEIDRIISRTLGYAIVTGLLVGVYAGLVLLATGVLRVHTPVAVAAATLAAAALFSPLRRRVQHAVDRRFNRARYDADQTVAAFAARLKDAVDLDSVQDDLAGVVHQVLEPAHVSVWMSQRD